MNPLLSRLQPYPFERLKQLFAGVTPVPEYAPISLGIGEPKHATPDFIKEALSASLGALAAYPATAGDLKLRTAFTDWLQTRYSLALDPATQVLPVNGSREALFSLAQTVIDATVSPQPVVLSPNPFYQIYEGAALLSGAEPYYVPSVPSRNFAVDWDSVPDDIWARTQLVFVCSPGNPTGAVMALDEWQKLFALSDRHGFVIAADECYTEIFLDESAPPPGLLQACVTAGHDRFQRCVVFHSLSKRSSVPGLRSGFVAGDPEILKSFLLYRTYHGSAMAVPTQLASIAAWDEDSHAVANRRLYQEKFARVLAILAGVMKVEQPAGAFYLWPDVGGDDERFTRELFARKNITVLPGSYLARGGAGAGAGVGVGAGAGDNPGAGRVRISLVPPVAQCVEAAERIRDFLREND